jgi:predicted dienelactone hydrolase
MRPFEILTPMLLIGFLIFPAFGRVRSAAINTIPVLLVAVTLLHLVIEKYRWQMIPLYVLVAILFIVWLRSFFVGHLAAPTMGVRIAASAGILATLIGTTLPALLPVPSVMKPTGPYQVGTATYVLIDNSRKELYSGKDEPRKFMIQVWYPGKPNAGAQLAPWMDNADIVAPALTDTLHLPHFFLDHLALAQSSSYENAPFNKSGAPYPVILFSHGWKGFRAQSTFLMQELASRGYVVVSMEHTYGDAIAMFPDGQVAYNNPNALLPDSAPIDDYERAARLVGNQWAGDLSYALDTLTQWNQSGADGRFAGMLDLTKVGVSGHSTGGGAAIQFCATDSRCKAGLSLDPWVRPVSCILL